MKELYLEQVFVGSIGILIGVLPWLPELLLRLDSLNAALGVASGSLALGLAFLIGIPLDRWADTLTERLERHARLLFALKRTRPDQRLTVVPGTDRLAQDLYPEDRLHARILRGNEHVVAWLHYHRSRIRLTRALAAFGPALTASLTIGVTRAREVSTGALSVWWLVAIAVAYLTWSLVLWRQAPLPKTYEASAVSYAQRWRVLESTSGGRRRGPDGRVWRSERVLFIPIAMLLVALSVAVSSGDSLSILACSVAVLLTVLSAWSWWRIGYTYRTYLVALAGPRSALHAK